MSPLSTFQTRALSAAVFGVVMLIGLFWNETSFTLLFTAIAIGCFYEFLKLNLGVSKKHLFLYFFVGIIAFFSIISLNIFTNLGSWNLNRVIGWGLEPTLIIFLMKAQFYGISLITFILFIVELFSKSEKPFNNIAIFLLGLFYTLFPFILLKSDILTQSISHSFDTIQANKNNFTPHIVAGMLFLTWANDTFAYIIGSKIGKTPLFSRISPKKTWEGTIGGGLMCMLTAGVISLFFKDLNIVNWVVLGGIVAIFGTLGDLVESMLKRSVGVKDSGNIMPGHGGFLDRFDAFMFTIPFVYLFLLIFKG